VHKRAVIPAQAGIQRRSITNSATGIESAWRPMPFTAWIPACAGMTQWCARALLVAALGAAISAFADEWKFGGHAKYRYTYTDFRADDLAAVTGEDPARDHGLDLRLKAERRAGAWDVAVHYELLGIAGDTLATRRRLAELGLAPTGTVSGLPDDRRRLFDLTHELADDDRVAVVHRLDRFALGYSTDAAVVRAGRQIISWGNGLAFHPLDFVNPFSPLAIDKDYKTGDDMLYGQRMLAGGGDVQAIVVPRRDPATHDLERDQSTYAAKLRRRLGACDLDFIGARHYDETLLGVGLARGVGGAVWRLDVGYADLVQEESAWSVVTNVDYSWVWAGRNVYGYVEYFRSGVGESARAQYATPNPALAQRLARGELFTLARDYLALGVQIELDPLVNLFGGTVANLNDASIYLQLRAVYDWRQDTQLMAGVELPRGERGDEFGGIPLAGGYAEPGRAAWVRAAHYF
jgi:hypothetical protein